jgi:virginiamycin A acetyltransferase
LPAPDPTKIHPDVYAPHGGLVLGWPQVALLKPLVQSPLTEVGEYTYYADPDDPTCFERNNVLYHYGPDRLIIGKYCGLARGVRFIMGAANHQMGLSTFPFPMLGADWLEHMGLFAARPPRGDTVVGNDVWLGYHAIVMPGARIGHGAIVAANAVVSSDIPPYCVAAGNPAQVVRQRFSDADIERLLDIAWWDWPVELVTKHIGTIMGSDLDALYDAARASGRLALRTSEKRAG